MTTHDKKKVLQKSFIITGGIALFFAVAPGLFLSFEAASDAEYPDWLVIALRDTREWILRYGAFRSLLFFTGVAGVLWFMVREKLKSAPAIALLTGLIIIDLWTVDLRYLNNSAFRPKGVNTAQPSPVDLEILQDKSSYRVLNFTATFGPFNDGTTSFFHQSIGGYHGAKMKRYQELIEHHISRYNMDVLSMLNTKYFIIPDRETGQPFKQTNPDALGNAWPVEQIRWVNNADEEIEALNDFDPASEAVIDKRYQPVLEGFSAQSDSTASIELINYEPNHLVYEYQSQLPQMVVFSEIFFSKGWNAYIDGKPAPHIRANYVLRAMAVPAGKHEIVFKFEPASYARGERIALFSSIGIVLLILGVVTIEIRKFKTIK